MEHLLTFLRAYCLLNDHNQLAILSAHAGGSRFLYPTEQQDTTHSSDLAHQAINYASLKDTLLDALAMDETADGDDGTEDSPAAGSCYSAFSGALSLALPYINRIQKENRHLTPRLLLIKASPDSPAQYIPTMNCIFAAQKMELLIDTCVLAAEDSTHGQQAALLTGGLYLRPIDQASLLQYLLSLFIVDTQTRQFMNMPHQADVDYRAACFCHKKAVDIGHVCSVCLSVFCRSSATCSTCGSNFASGSSGSGVRRVAKRTRKSLGE